MAIYIRKGQASVDLSDLKFYTWSTVRKKLLATISETSDFVELRDLANTDTRFRARAQGSYYDGDIRIEYLRNFGGTSEWIRWYGYRSHRRWAIVETPTPTDQSDQFRPLQRLEQAHANIHAPAIV